MGNEKQGRPKMHNTSKIYKVSCLKQGSEINGFCLKQGHGLKTLSTLGDRAFAAAAPKLWNQLPSELRRITFIDHFKRALKAYLFKKAFY